MILDPDEEALGPDALSLTLRQLRAALADEHGAPQGRLMDQHRVAGLGNLLTDEILWRAGLDPAQVTRSLDDDEVRRLHHHIRTGLGPDGGPGGSTRGTCRRPGTGGCVPEGRHAAAPAHHRRRTTYSCPLHQA